MQECLLTYEEIMQFMDDKETSSAIKVFLAIKLDGGVTDGEKELSDAYSGLTYKRVRIGVNKLIKMGLLDKKTEQGKRSILTLTSPQPRPNLALAKGEVEEREKKKERKRSKKKERIKEKEVIQNIPPVSFNAFLIKNKIKKSLKEDIPRKKNHFNGRDFLCQDIFNLFYEKAKNIIERLNAETGKRFFIEGEKGKKNLKIIVDRLKEGATEEEMIDVIILKVHDWQEDNPKMFGCLRPSTLFSKKNYENYVAELPAFKLKYENDHTA